MSYIVFARKYRPQTFDDIAGQPHITTTLKNAILQNRVAHAYIFAGPRGVGKTTTARILAKALNCDKGPTVKPCDSCESCKEIIKSTSLDILEIDGASNRGIDEIRNLKENVKFSPAKGRFKVYIIDEVHMLTPEAFNALLKTLEEPPRHVKFIFATTQAHKVPPTILSRCQRFDFRRLAAKDILDNLRKIAKNENLNVNDEALMLMAKYSDGSMRDGQVILDQIASFTKELITPEDVTGILGIVDEEVVFGLSLAIAQKDAKSALMIIDEIVNGGKEVFQAITGLIEHFRSLAIVKMAGGKISVIDAGEDRIKRCEAESEKFSIEEILYVIYTLANTIDLIRRSGLQRFLFEMAVIKLIRRGSIMSLDEMMGSLDKFQTSLKGDKSQRPGRVIKECFENTAKETDDAAGVITDASPKESASPPPDSPAMKGADLGEVLSAWGEVIKYIKAKKISIASYLQEGYPVSLENSVLSIAFPKEFQFHKEVLESQENRFLIEEALRSEIAPNLKVLLISEKAAAITQGDRARRDYLAQDGEIAQTDENALPQQDPIVKTALEIFGGGVISDGAAKKGRPR